MKKWNRKKMEHRRPAVCGGLMAAWALCFALCGCAEAEGQEQEQEETQQEQADTESLGAFDNESAADTRVDIPALQEENPDVFGWLYIPGTDIDDPVLQSEQADDYYEEHNALGEESEEGALYTELANGKNMCDFMTVVHGKCSADGTEGQFSQLYQFLDQDFFENNPYAYFYIDGNLLTYCIFAAYEREDTSLIRSYDFSYLSGCQQFLDDFYGDRQMGKNLREGWDGLTPSHFLVAFTTTRGSGKQLVVLGALIGDAAGTIEGAVIE